MSVGVGTACTLYEPLVVLEALALTGSVTVSLTAYTFWAARKGVSFQKWGPMLFTCAPPACHPQRLFTLGGRMRLRRRLFRPMKAL